jgi:L-amino acid N-acyltransferase YncA
MQDVQIRQATPADAAALSEIVNAIIAIGGTTALETPLSAAEFDEHFLTGRDCIFCLMAESASGEVLGFQCLGKHPDLPTGGADIGTFTRRVPRIPGVGRALFQHTVAFARQSSIVAINATIRADNASGIPYYEKMGFATYRTAKAVPLKDGTPVDRVSKKYVVG